MEMRSMATSEERIIFRDRVEAGEKLAEKLGKYRGTGAVVFGIPRGGVPVGIEVARRTGALFDILVTRKIPVPGNPETGYGAVGEDGSVVLNKFYVSYLGLTEAEIEADAEKVRAEVSRRTAVFREKACPVSVSGRTAVIVDDGLATGYTMMAAVQSIRKRNASRIVAAVPVSSNSAYDLISPEVDELVSIVISMTHSFAVARFYNYWSDMSDGEVMESMDGWLSSQFEVDGYMTAGGQRGY
jgi:predicted phosphoribosyltransferase